MREPDASQAGPPWITESWADSASHAALLQLASVRGLQALQAGRKKPSWCELEGLALPRGPPNAAPPGPIALAKD